MQCGEGTHKLRRRSDRWIDRIVWCAFGSVQALSAPQAVATGVPPSAAAFTRSTFWSAGFAAAPRIPLAGDADADGRADLLAVYPDGDCIIDISRTSPLGKPIAPLQARTRFGTNALAAVSGAFTARGNSDVAAIFADGSVRVASGMRSGQSTFERDDLASTIPIKSLPKRPLLASVTDFDEDGRPDVLIAGSDGRMLLLRGQAPVNGDPHFIPETVAGRIPKVIRLAAGTFAPKAGGEAVWMDRAGVAYRTRLRFGDDGSVDCELAVRLLNASPGDGLAVGRFLGASDSDILVGRQLLRGGDAATSVTVDALPDAAEAKGDIAWIAADINGDGRDDLIRVRRSGDRFTGDDIIVHFATGGGDTWQSTAGDGILDIWKSGQIKPGVMDLSALGCSIGRRDVIVEVQRFENVDDAHVRRELGRVVKYFASLPIVNPDGTSGISLHVIFREPIPMSDAGKGWWELGEKYHPVGHRGVSHWMVVSRGGGGQSGTWTDRGGCGDNGLYATFTHEFGHQLGLDHNGYWGAVGCPTYPSLMNYPYNYQLNGRGDDIRYSDGRLSSIVLDETNLNERLPLPMEQVAFLAGPPYHYHLKPSGDGKSTLVDWNWNGVFGEKGISADINYGYSTTAGLRHTIGKTYCAPTLTTVGTGRKARLLLFVGRLPEGASLIAPEAAGGQAGLSTDQPGRLRVRVWLGKDPSTDGDNWSDERNVEAKDVTGEASAATGSADTWVSYPTLPRVRIRRVSLDPAGLPVVGEALDVPNTANAQPTLARVGHRLVLLLWRGPEAPIGVRVLVEGPNGLSVGEEVSLPITSTVPPGAVAGAMDGAMPSLWVALAQNQDAGRPSRWQVRRMVLGNDGALAERDREWVGGESGQERGTGRLLVLWESNRAFPQGQLYVFGRGDPGGPWACHYVATRIADKAVNGGWLTRRYYDEWTQSRSAPAACFFRGDVAFASRWYGNVHGTENDNVFVGFYGTGIDREPMGDFDDIGLIRDAGLTHSITYFPN